MQGMPAADASHPALAWLASQQEAMAELLTRWVAINTGSTNVPGLQHLASELQHEFASLGANLEVLTLNAWQRIRRGQLTQQPLGPLLHWRKRPQAPVRVLLCIHMDTVYGPQHPFQQPVREGNILRGPGAADAKAGLVIMLKALQAFEQMSEASALGWEVIINPDEEIGSPGSDAVLMEAARRCKLGLLFEPALPGGVLVSERKGTGNFELDVRGRSAHAGRDFARGRNAIAALARAAAALDALNTQWAAHDSTQGITLNVGSIEGGGELNVVPDHASAGFNVRITQPAQADLVSQQIQAVVAQRQVAEPEGIQLELRGGVLRPPKVCDAATQQLMHQISQCALLLGESLEFAPSGGASDGNTLAAAGLPNLDTLGGIGGNIHSDQEFVELPSLPRRAMLTALLLRTLARDAAGKSV